MMANLHGPYAERFRQRLVDRLDAEIAAKSKQLALLQTIKHVAEGLDDGRREAFLKLIEDLGLQLPDVVESSAEEGSGGLENK